MNQLLRTMLKDESSLVIRTPENDKQVILATSQLPTSKSEFTKFFTVSTSRIVTKNQSNICIGGYLLSNRSLGQIKFQSNDNHFLTWLKKTQIFIESDSLGVDRPITIGYLTKIDPDLTNLAFFRDHLANQLMLIEVEDDTAIALAPHLQQAQLDAMTNGDDFVPILPCFELYKTRLSHGRDPSKVTTEVIGINGAPKDAKLLGEFFTRFAAENSDNHRDGVFLPKGAAALLGPTTYEQVLKEHNFFLTQVVTIPVNMEYNAWFAVIDPANVTDDSPISLNNHLTRQPWFLRIESAARNKCLLVTTKPNLQTAREWIDTNLESMVRKSIPPGSDPPSALLPRRLDKPVYSTTCQTYADILKKQYSLAPSSTTPETTNKRPPRKRQATIIDYDSDESIEKTCDTPKRNMSTNSNSNAPQTSSPPPPPPPDYAKELISLQSEIQQLKSTLMEAIAAITKVVASLQSPTQQPTPNAMDTDEDRTTNPNSSMAPIPSPPLDLPAIIHELKTDIATIATELRAAFQSAARQPFQLTPFPT